MPSITPIHAFEDNYVWLLREPGWRRAVVVDPGDEEPVIAALEESGLDLAAILITHHHYDHIGGVEDLLAEWPDAQVFGPPDRRIPAVNRPVGEGAIVAIPGLSITFRVLEVPGHTSSHIAYFGGGALFCGDTLFAAGCGRVFDGTSEQLAASLERIAALPPDTLVYCAHEYTLANLGFAEWVEPNSASIAERTTEARRVRELGLATVPSRLAEELTTNPFLRTDVPEVKEAAERFAGRPLRASAEIFAALRRWKDEKYD